MIACVRRAAASLRLTYAICIIRTIASTSISSAADIAARIRASLAIVDARRNAADGVNVRLRIDELAAELSRDELWQKDAARAQEISREHGRLQQSVAERDAIASETAAAEELLELANSERDEPLVAESKATLEACLKRADRLELEALMDRKFDHCDCFIEVAAGAGGEDAVDFAQMLLRMYRGWGARNSFDVSDFGPNRIRLSGPVRLQSLH
jgi:peptide chain release factor 2